MVNEVATGDEIKKIEQIAQKLYTDWNKSEDFTWDDLPDYRQNVYREWVEEYVLPLFRGD